MIGTPGCGAPLATKTSPGQTAIQYMEGSFFANKTGISYGGPLCFGFGAGVSFKQVCDFVPDELLLCKYAGVPRRQSCRYGSLRWPHRRFSKPQVLYSVENPWGNSAVQALFFVKAEIPFDHPFGGSNPCASFLPGGTGGGGGAFLFVEGSIPFPLCGLRGGPKLG